MTSETASSTGGAPVYVWFWLPGATDPVVVGVLVPIGARLGGDAVLAFRYAASYLARADRLSLYPPELPLTDDALDPRRARGREPLALAGCLRDAAPDAWGRRVIGLGLGGRPDVELSEATYLLASGSDRIGALDFQESPRDYVTRDDGAPLDELARAAELVERGERLSPALDHALRHGTSIGGARPKALLRDEGRSLIAKFSSTADHRPVVQAEGVAMLLAARAGLDVARVEHRRVAGKEVLLVERFDRQDHPSGRMRRQVVSLLTVLGLSESSARYASYADLARAIRTGPWVDVPQSLRELYGRLALNVVVGNTDDHLRNHSAFWDGTSLRLTPAYDIAPQARSTDPASHAIGIVGANARASQLRLVRAVAADFLLSAAEADSIIDRVRTAVHEGWREACDAFELSTAVRDQLWGREFANSYIDYDEA